ncbi:hypothetical protein [Enterococcus faecium]|nr:hypothetical protein [Listeria monocytogenes]EAC5259332.1 hypothetical protein [Listeria monocytogenes]
MLCIPMVMHKNPSDKSRLFVK